MTKQQFVAQLAKRTKLTKKDVGNVVDTAMELIIDNVKKKGKVTLTGFGTFESRRQKATTRMNPQTGRRMNVPGKKFREALGK